MKVIFANNSKSDAITSWCDYEIFEINFKGFSVIDNNGEEHYFKWGKAKHYFVKQHIKALKRFYLEQWNKIGKFTIIYKR